MEQIDGKASVKVKIGTQSEVLLLPEGPADLTKSLAPGDAIEGTYTRASGDNNAKTLQTVTLKSAGISALAAAVIMGLGVVSFLLIAMLILKVGKFKLRKLVIGGDNRTSNSKTQAAIWFGIVIAAYIATLLARIWYGGWEYIGKINIPQNLLI
ncbi:MAG: hypothetical protein HY268_05285, partial [Deltaproteobacteria bacterium]|nr:hypothetical protein [Deltaproteobacteria bacterium]